MTYSFVINDWEEYYGYSSESNGEGAYVPGRIFGHTVTAIPIIPFPFYYRLKRPDFTFIIYDSHDPGSDAYSLIEVERLALVDQAFDSQVLISEEDPRHRYSLDELSLDSPARGVHHFVSGPLNSFGQDSGFQVQMSGRALSKDGEWSSFRVDEPWHFAKGRRFEVVPEYWGE